MKPHPMPTSIYYTLSLLGLWLIASTLTFGFENLSIIYTNLIAGLFLLFFGSHCRKGATALQIWAITAIGIWLQLSPLIFWAPHAASYVNDTFVGSWIIALTITLHPLPGHSNEEKGTIPPGWSYNPSAWPQRLPIAFLAFVCWMVSRYLSAYQLGYIDTVWDPFFSPGTKAVLESTVSRAFPVSDAGLGAFAYTLEFFAACQGGPNRWKKAPWLVLVFGILVIPVSIVSTILIILQPLVVGTWCTLCLFTAVCMLIAIPFAVGEVVATLQFLKSSKEKPLFSLLFFGGNCPKETPDTLSPPMSRPLKELMTSALSGLSFPLGLVAVSFLGIFLMATPTVFDLTSGFSKIDPIFGALTILTSVISFAEPTRHFRFANLCIGAIWLLLVWVFPFDLFWTLFHTLIIGSIAIFSIPKGKIREQWSLKL